MNKKFYITTAIPYVNAAPHLGHTLEFIQADVLARYHQLLNEKVTLLSGADENAQKNVQAAKENNIAPQKWCDINSQKFFHLKTLLNLTDNFIFQRSSDKKHYSASQKLWNLCKKEDIYLKKYKGFYCLGCEAFITAKELVNGCCPEHPNQKPQVVEEENYFFKLTAYAKLLSKLIQSDQLEIIPQERKNEVLAFIKQGLQDFSISRSAKRMAGWGIPVPHNPNQVMYVWFDALNVYQSGVGFGWDEKKYQKWWPADIHCIGKGILRFHAVYWPAILKSARLKLPKKIFVHGYLTIEGKKISKSLGNVISPQEVVIKYGTDALRYYLLKTIHPYQDGDFSWKLFNEVYNADLANGLGNLVQRVAKMAEKINLPGNKNIISLTEQYSDIASFIQKFEFNNALNYIWQYISSLDKFINRERPWEKTASESKKILGTIIVAKEGQKGVLNIASLLIPFLPETAEKIIKIFTAPKITAPGKPLFPRV